MQLWGGFCVYAYLEPAMHPRKTMTDVARAAGVHPTTVSLSFRNHPSIPAATRQRICKIAEEIGYRPDPVLSALNAYRHENISHHEGAPLAYVHDAGDSSESLAHREALCAGAFARAGRLGYRIERFEVGGSGLTYARLNGILRARGISGVLLAASAAGGGPRPELEWPHYCTVKIERHAHDPSLDCVATDRHGIVRLGLQQALECGYRRIGLVLPRRYDEESDLAWSSGYLAAQYRLPERLRLPVYYTEGDRPGCDSDSSAFARWLGRHTPELVMAQGDIIRPLLAAQGIVVPRDLAFVDIDLGPGSDDAGIRHAGSSIGELAVDHLVRQMQHLRKGLAVSPTLTLVGGLWQDGASMSSRVGEMAAACGPAQHAA